MQSNDINDVHYLWATGLKKITRSKVNAKQRGPHDAGAVTIGKINPQTIAFKENYMACHQPNSGMTTGSVTKP